MPCARPAPCQARFALRRLDRADSPFGGVGTVGNVPPGTGPTATSLRGPSQKVNMAADSRPPRHGPPGPQTPRGPRVPSGRPGAPAEIPRKSAASRAEWRSLSGHRCTPRCLADKCPDGYRAARRPRCPPTGGSAFRHRVPEAADPAKGAAASGELIFRTSHGFGGLSLDPARSRENPPATARGPACGYGATSHPGRTWTTTVVDYMFTDDVREGNGQRGRSEPPRHRGEAAGDRVALAAPGHGGRLPYTRTRTSAM